ncbi:MAG: hypothetical protein AABY46_07080 [Nitrospirota bacterium]
MNPYYRSDSRYLKETFPCKVYKIAIDAGFTCPNIDGPVAYGGCAYCDNKSFSPNSRMAPRPVRGQILSGMEFYRRRFGAEKFIVYFQAFTNTHGPVDHLKKLYDEALVMGELNDDYVVAPLWGKTKSEILRLIDQEFERRGSRQGKRHLLSAA